MASKHGMFVQGSSLKAEIERYQEYENLRVNPVELDLEPSDGMLDLGAQLLATKIGLNSNRVKVWPDDFHYNQVVQLRAEAGAIWCLMAKQYLKEKEAKCSKQ